jgi:hypothetical protein
MNSEEQIKKENEPTEEVVTGNESGYKTDKERQLSTRDILNEVIPKLRSIEETLDGEDETILATSVMDFEDALEQTGHTRFENELFKALQNF